MSFSAPQNGGMTAKGFQASIIQNLGTTLASQPRPPCLLRSPTGSGKTFMLTQVLQNVSSKQPVLWLWFVPYVNLVAQTQDALDNLGQDSGLAPRNLQAALNEEPEAGLVLISTVQGVASSKARVSGYTLGEDDTHRNLRDYRQKARTLGFSIGVVVDEAHIALKDNTEFGAFVKWLEADYLLMASATPRDDALNKFIAASGYSNFKTFNISRAQVVQERLNKAWIQAAIYPLSNSNQSVTDLKMTVLRRAWRQNQKIAIDLQSRGLHTVPLMLVQVADGDEAIKEAHEFLMRDLSIPAHAIGVHSALEPDPVMMASIANDSTKQVLVFKKSAGTGFDAPRAFVLASTKLVNDADFAMQFIGRVMRVPQELQRAFPSVDSTPMDLNTAYVFLADAQSQAGFTQAATAIAGVQAELEGQTERLYARATAHGGVALTNRPTAQAPLVYDLAFMPVLGSKGEIIRPNVQPDTDNPQPSLPLGITDSLFGNANEESQSAANTFNATELDGLLDEANDANALATPSGVTRAKKSPRQPANREELLAAFAEVGIAHYPRKTTIAANAVPERFMTESKPVFDVLKRDVHAAVAAMPLDASLLSTAVLAAFDKLTDKEIRTELFSGDESEDDVQVITDHEALMAQTVDALMELGLEEVDCADVIKALASRLAQQVESSWQLQSEDHRVAKTELPSVARSAACWVIRKQGQELEQALSAQWASRADEKWAQLLPDVLIAPTSVSFEPSRKSTYGVYYSALGTVNTEADKMTMEGYMRLKSDVYVFADGVTVGSGDVMSVAKIDAGFEFNPDELAFAKALDRESSVIWWHRNPDRKPFSVALMRADNQQMFYPDFVVCLTHLLDDAPLLRLIETKHDTKDAARKAQHVSRYYGKVLFLTKDASRVKIVNDDGSLGDVVDFDNLDRLRRWMHDTKPQAQSFA